MKQFILTIFAILISLISFAQVTEKMSYQAIIRDSNNQLVVNQAIKMRISIWRIEANSVNGHKSYEEVHTTTTNVNGLVSIQIGDGMSQSGQLDTIRWGLGPHFMKREIDLTGTGTNYSITGSSELLSVPYARLAKNAIYSDHVANYAGGDYVLNQVVSSSSTPANILTTNQLWFGDRRIMMNGYVTLIFNFPAIALSNNITYGKANLSMYLKYDGQTIMPVDFKNMSINENARITLPISALIPNSTGGNLKQFTFEVTENSSETGMISSIPNTYGPYPIDVKVTVVMSWVEL